MEKLREFIIQKPMLTTIVLIFIELFLLQLHFGSTPDSLPIQVLKNLLLALIVFSFIYLINGKEELIFSTKGIGFAFKECLLMLIIAVATGIIFSVLLIVGKHPLNNNIWTIIIELLLFTFFHSFFEEALTRGLFLNALLIKFGETFIGIIKTVTYSSVFFGFIHVIPDFINSLFIPGFLNLSVIEQMIGKVIEMAMFGFILAAVYLNNHNLWSVTILHMINDFLMDLPGHLFTNLGNLGTYVNASGNQNILIYIIMSVLSIPGIIVGYKLCKNVSLPQPGFFKVCWFPITVKNKKA